MKEQETSRYHTMKFTISCIVWILLFDTNVFSQNNMLVLNGAYLNMNGGSNTSRIYLVVNQNSALGIVRISGHIHSEGQYNIVKWNTDTGTGDYIFPFGVAGNANDYIPFTFNKTTTGSTTIGISTWSTNQQNLPHPATSNVAAVNSMIGTTDSVRSAIDRFWDIQSPFPVTADLTFSYRGSENTTLIPTDTFRSQHWNGTVWEDQAGQGNPGVIAGIGKVGPVTGRTTFSPWVLTRAGLNASIVFSQDLNCNGQCTGMAVAKPVGGTPPYTYSWSPNGGSTDTVKNLCAGKYYVTVKDAVNSTVVDSVEITEPSAINAVTNATPTTCGLNTGSASVNASGGTGNLTYLWSNGQTTATITGLAPGTYTVTVTDASNCTNVQTAVVGSSSALITMVTSTPTVCNGNNGTATATPANGTAPYTYVWNNGQTTATITGLIAGTYTVTVTDATNCSSVQTVIVASSSALMVTTATTPTACNTNNGTASATPISGTPPYTYLWSNGQTTSTANGLGAGNHTVTVTDMNGCTQTISVSVAITAGPTASASTASSTILLGGQTQLNASGGVSYSWSPPKGLSCTNCQNPMASPATTTDYCVLVTDTNGCSDSTCLTIQVDIPCDELFVPSAFSPNNDGHNDLLCLRGTCIQSINFIVYNRWGESVFETTDQKICWDGTYKGKLENTAVFVYSLNAILTNGVKISKKGTVSLIR